MGNQIWECKAENVLVSLSMLVGIWLTVCLRRDLNKPAGSAKTPKHPLHFQQAPWHFPSSAASRTSVADLQLDTCFKSSLRLCQRKGAKHDELLQFKAGRWFLCYVLLYVVNVSGKSIQILQRSSICCYLSPTFFFSSFFPLPPPLQFLPPLSWSENSRKLECILKWRRFCLAWSKVVLYISGHVLNTHKVSYFLVFKPKFFYRCLRI